MERNVWMVRKREWDGENRERWTGNRQRDKDRLSATHHCGLSHWQQSLPPSQPSIMVMEAPSEHWFLGIVGRREGLSVLNGSARLVKARQARVSAWITLTFLYVWLTRQSCNEGSAVHVLFMLRHCPSEVRTIGKIACCFFSLSTPSFTTVNYKNEVVKELTHLILQAMHLEPHLLRAGGNRFRDVS